MGAKFSTGRAYGINELTYCNTQSGIGTYKDITEGARKMDL